MLYPYPGNFMLAWFEPWKSANLVNGAITIAHKAVIDDAFKILLPLRMLAVDLMKHGQLPMWNPYQGAGTPLAAVMHPGFFNPFGIFFFFLPVHFAWTIFVFLQLVVLGMAIYFYARAVGMSKIASLFATATLVFSGFVTVRLEYTEFLYGYAGLPLLFLCIEHLRTKAKSWQLLAIPIIATFIIFAGQPFMTFWVFLLAALYALVRLGFTKKLILYAWLMIIGICMASIQLIPTIELYLNSSMRNAGASSFLVDRFLVPWWHLITIAIPNFFGNHATYNYFGVGGDSIETTAFVGVIPLVLALFAMLNNKCTTVQKYFMGMLTISILMAVDWWGSRILHTLPIPVISTEAPSRLFAFSTFAIAMLAGCGMDGLQNAKGRMIREIREMWIIGAVVLIIALGGAALYFFGKISCPATVATCRIVPLRTTALESAWVVLAAMGVFAFYKLRKQWTLFIVIGAVMAGGLYNQFKFLPFSPASSFFPESDLISSLQTQEIGYPRTMGFGEARIFANILTGYHVADPNYYNPLNIKRYAEFVSYANTGEYGSTLNRSDIEIVSNEYLLEPANFRRERLLYLLGVGNRIYKKEGSFTVGKTNGLPHSFVVKAYRVVPDDKTLLAALFDPAFDPSQAVLLEQAPALDMDSLYVTNDTYYPGWKAYVDGKRTSLLRANYTFRAVPIPPGEHDVKIVYEPLSWEIGIILSVGSVVVLAFTVLLRISHHRLTWVGYNSFQRKEET